MAVATEAFAAVRLRANAACEYCGVTEEQSGGKLTIDHFRPVSHGGTDSIENLVYACFRCNGYKADYWPSSPTDRQLWNPRESPATTHIFELADGRLLALTPIGSESIRRLRLNRDPLVRGRRRAREEQTRVELLARMVELSNQVARVRADRVRLSTEENALLTEQKQILDVLSRIGS